MGTRTEDMQSAHRAVQAPCKPPTRQPRFMPHASRSSRPSAPSAFPHMPSMPPSCLCVLRNFMKWRHSKHAPSRLAGPGLLASGSTEHATTTQYRDPCRSKWARSSKKVQGHTKRPRTTQHFKLFYLNKQMAVTASGVSSKERPHLRLM